MNRDALAESLLDLVDHVVDEYEARLRADVLMLALPPERRPRPHCWTPPPPVPPTRGELTADLRDAMRDLIRQACALDAATNPQ